ncbi:MAG TPA: hypothetical protein VI818_08425 [Candidatus Thermoplasmatota archaeon]|nr:hypothetical protein [Candidatus Thermoplasmatota archaeon]
MRVALLGTIFVASLLFAGCLDNVGGSKNEQGKARLGKDGTGQALGFADDWAELVLAGGETHNHVDITQHMGRSTPNFEVVGHNPLLTDYYGRTAGGHFCGDVREKDGRRISVVHSWVSDIAFIISDVTDPRNPQKIGEFTLQRTHVYDLALTDDMKTVLLATSPGAAQLQEEVPVGPIGGEGPFATFRDACTGEVREVMGPEQGLPMASGIIVVDIANPRNPSITDFRFFPVNGGHSVVTRDIGGRPLLLISVPNGGLPIPGGSPLGPTPNSYYVIAELMEHQTGRKINILSVYQYAALNSAVPGVKVPGGMHDGYLHKHPVTGKWLAYLAYGASSLVIIDVEDPKNPKFLSHWNDWAKIGDAAPATPFVHEALPMNELWDGKHYTFIGEECGGRRAKTPTCMIMALDTTDPTKPTFVGGWTLPAETGSWGGAMFSPHYLAVINRTLFITTYHGGVWAVDVSNPETLFKMPSIGVFMPDIPSPKPVTRRLPYDFGPVVLDALPLSDGTLLVYDGYTGLYSVKFDAAHPAPSPDPWPLNYNQ